MSVDDSPSKQIADLQRRLVELDRERADVRAALEQLQRQVTASDAQTATSPVSDAVASPVLSNTEKIAVFRSLFRCKRRSENPSLEATEWFGSAGVKLRQMEALCLIRQRARDEGRGTLREGTTCGSD